MRRDSDEDSKACVRLLNQEEGVDGEDDDPTDEELRRFDRGRKGKRCRTRTWGRKPTRTLVSSAERAVDQDTEVVLSTAIYHGTDSDTAALLSMPWSISFAAKLTRTSRKLQPTRDTTPVSRSPTAQPRD